MITGEVYPGDQTGFERECLDAFWFVLQIAEARLVQAPDEDGLKAAHRWMSKAALNLAIVLHVDDAEDWQRAGIQHPLGGPRH
jgi:hypothetical protein